MKSVPTTLLVRAIGVGGLVMLAACSSVDKSPPPSADGSNAQMRGSCSMQGIGQLQIDAQTRIIAVRHFKRDEDVRLDNTAAPYVRAPVDVCMVKLVVGPGNPGPAGAASTSPGIGIEVWLPSPDRWNRIIRSYGSGGWAGGYYADATRIGQSGGSNPLFLAAVQKGYAVSGSDHGHGGTVSGRNASFTMKPDGTPNTVLWRDFSERSLLEQALKTKAVVKAYYGQAQDKAYFDGFSTGGRQGYKLAQRYPDQYDGILAGAPAFNWTRFITAELFPQVVMQRDLGRTIPNAKLHAASARALASCGGAQASWGFLLDPLACTYSAVHDAAALCQGERGEAGVMGQSTATTCLTSKEAVAVQKIWYGMTRKGQAVATSVNTPRSGSLAIADDQLWWGLTRGTDLTALAGDEAPFPIASQMAALSLGNPRIAQKGMFNNATGSAEDGWKTLGYDDLVKVYERGLAMQTVYSDINTDAVDLSVARSRGAKILSYHGLSDQLIMPQGSLNYFDRLVHTMGGVDEVASFNRLFFVPGMGHSGSFNLTASVGIDGAVTPYTHVPLPQPSTGRDELFNALRDWVENGVAPEKIMLTAASGRLSLPICAHPKKPAPVLGATGAPGSVAYECR